MSTKEPKSELPPSPDKSQETVQMTQGTSGNLSGDLQPGSNQSSSSGDTEESLAAYADHTLRALASIESQSHYPLSGRGLNLYKLASNCKKRLEGLTVNVCHGIGVRITLPPILVK